MASGTDSEYDQASDAQAAIESAIAYQFQSAELFQRAMTHRSFSSDHNERMEFLGDSVLNLSIARSLYHRFPQASEGDLSRMLASLVKGDTLGEVALELGLGEHIRLGAGESKSGGRRRQSILADTVESLLGAVYLDADFDTADCCVARLFASRINAIDPGSPAKDAKTMLQERLQAEQQALPEYRVVRSWGKAHQRKFEVACRVSLLAGECLGSGGSRREAEQMAANVALEKLLKHD